MSLKALGMDVDFLLTTTCRLLLEAHWWVLVTFPRTGT